MPLSSPVVFRLQAAALLGLTLLVSACSTVKEKRSSYLQDTAQLQVSPTDKRARVWRSGTPASSFDSYRVGSIKFLAPEAGLSAGQKKLLTDRLEASLQQNFNTAWPNKPHTGRNTLEINGAITAADKANVWLNVAAFTVLNFPVSTGGVAVELEAVSKPDSKRVACGQYIMPGRIWQLIASHTQTGHARSGIDKASAQFCTLVTGVKVKPKAPKKPATQGAVAKR